MKYPTPEDIAEMKARGYDPSTIEAAIEAARQQAARWPVAQEVRRVIEEAFAGVTLGGGVGLKEGLGLDDYADVATLAAYRATDEKDDWRRISAGALNNYHSSLSFFDAEGMRFHLPAFLIADLHETCGTGMAFCLTHLDDFKLTRFELLSPPQRAAVRAFLLHILDDPEYQFERADIERALAEYWTDGSSQDDANT